MRQAHGAEEGRDDQRVGDVEPLRAAGRPAASTSRRRRPTRPEVRRRRPTTTSSTTAGTSRAVSLSQYWKACTKVMLRMPPDVHVGEHDQPRRSPARPRSARRPPTAGSGRRPGTAAAGRASRSRRPAPSRRRGHRASRGGPRRSRAACRRPSGAAARRPGPAGRGSRPSSRRGTRACRRRRPAPARRRRGTTRPRGTRRRSREALSRGRTVREATKKSLVVREKRSPQVPITRVATVTRVTATMPGAASRPVIASASSTTARRSPARCARPGVRRASRAAAASG